jgi:hypothetical protein
MSKFQTRALIKSALQQRAALDGILLPVGARAEAQPQPMLVTSTYAKPQPKQRRHKPETERLYARLREVPRDIPLEKAAQMYDHAQRPFPVPKHLRDRDWPDSWVKAWKDKAGGFRKKLSDLRQCALRAA